MILTTEQKAARVKAQSDFQTAMAKYQVAVKEYQAAVQARNAALLPSK